MADKQTLTLQPISNLKYHTMNQKILNNDGNVSKTAYLSPEKSQKSNISIYMFKWH